MNVASFNYLVTTLVPHLKKQYTNFRNPIEPIEMIGFTLRNLHNSPVGSEITSDVTLLDYLRNFLELRGTKYMCRQAGCGACIVAATRPGGRPEAVNSCMVSITSCQDWEIRTIEHLGNRKKGYHIIQKTLASHNGSQCGYCSPGWVMSMYSLLHSKQDLTMLEIEKSFGSNVCRCTGFRPILEAFKTFAKNAPKRNIIDIEDLKICGKSGKVCKGARTDDDGDEDCDFEKICKETYSDDDDKDWCVIDKEEVKTEILSVQLKDGRKWYRVCTVMDIFKVFQNEGTDSYMLVGGNTAKGAYPIDEYPRVLVDINGIPELKKFVVDQNLIIGGGTTLTQLLKIFKDMSKNDCFTYLKEFYNHLMLVAHIAVRNIGTISGNLMIKHHHNEFQSDLFLMFETVGAQLTILNNQCHQQSVTMEKFLKSNMRGAVILDVKLPPLNDDCKVKTYKVMPRSQNAHAIVNFGGLYKFTNNCDKVLQCRLAFGGLSPEFFRAKSTERLLVGKCLFNNETLQLAVKTLESELLVRENPPEPSAAYRKKLAVGLFYKSLLSLCPANKLNKKYASGTIKLREMRPLSEGRQFFETKSSLWPLNQPIPKIESLIQCAGEAIYTEDIPTFPHEVFGELVLSSVARGYIASINPVKALKYPGVIAFYSAKDIPGLNSFTPSDLPTFTLNEEILCSDEVKYYDQPIGIIVAETRHIAEVAVKMVEVTYKNVSIPVIDIKKAKNDPKRVQLLKSIDAEDRGNDIAKVIKGSNTSHGQYHFTLETIACVTRPTEEGLEVYVTSQWLDGVQVMISRALKIEANRIDVHIRRLGGAYGIKISRSILTAIACSLVATKLNRPCRFIHSMQTLTRAFGKRFPCSSEYEFGVNKKGVIQYGKYSIFEDNGYTVNEQLSNFAVEAYSNCYNNSRWNYRCFDVITDTAKNTWFRAPGTLEGVAMIEMVMEQISYELSLDPIQIRLSNLDPQYKDIKEMLHSMITEFEYIEQRAEINKFNRENRWKKRGLRFVPLRWHSAYPRYFDVNLSVYHSDGTVSIVHGGVEIGQGINTRAAQICAHFLQIPLSKIQVKPNNTIVCPNSDVTGGSITSQNIGIGVERCCKELLKRLEPVKVKMENPTWEDLITKAYNSGIDLQMHGFVNKKDIQDYNVYGVTLAKVEIDVLTGEMEVLRVDVMGDVGQSVSPALDVGQVEGAFIMGLGYWTSEELVYDKKSGELLTDRTWNYNVPLARDIPQDFRVYLRKNSYSNPAILGSKATGEPPICMAVAVPFAIKEAVAAARLDCGIPTTCWFPFDGPMTAENICLSTNTSSEEFKFN